MLRLIASMKTSNSSITLKKSRKKYVLSVISCIYRATTNRILIPIEKGKKCVTAVLRLRPRTYASNSSTGQKQSTHATSRNITATWKLIPCFEVYWYILYMHRSHQRPISFQTPTPTESEYQVKSERWTNKASKYAHTAGRLQREEASHDIKSLRLLSPINKYDRCVCVRYLSAAFFRLSLCFVWASLFVCSAFGTGTT